MARCALRPGASAMKVSTSVFSDTLSFVMSVASQACTFFGSRATNFPDATSLLLAACTASVFALSAQIAAFKAPLPLPLTSACPMVPPSDRQSREIRVRDQKVTAFSRRMRTNLERVVSALGRGSGAVHQGLEFPA